MVNFLGDAEESLSFRTFSEGITFHFPFRGFNFGTKLIRSNVYLQFCICIFRWLTRDDYIFRLLPTPAKINLTLCGRKKEKNIFGDFETKLFGKKNLGLFGNYVFHTIEATEYL